MACCAPRSAAADSEAASSPRHRAHSVGHHHAGRLVRREEEHGESRRERSRLAAAAARRAEQDADADVEAVGRRAHSRAREDWEEEEPARPAAHHARRASDDWAEEPASQEERSAEHAARARHGHRAEREEERPEERREALYDTRAMAQGRAKEGVEALMHRGADEGADEVTEETDQPVVPGGLCETTVKVRTTSARRRYNQYGLADVGHFSIKHDGIKFIPLFKGKCTLNRHYVLCQSACAEVDCACLVQLDKECVANCAAVWGRLPRRLSSLSHNASGLPDEWQWKLEARMGGYTLLNKYLKQLYLGMACDHDSESIVCGMAVNAVNVWGAPWKFVFGVKAGSDA